MKECAFCPTVATLTAEHCWGVWISKILPKTVFTIQRREFDGSFTRWKSKSLNVTAKVVCSSCNNGWMSDLERDAKATLENMILHGSPLSLLPIGIGSIAAFAFKGAVIANFMHPHRTPFHSVANRHGFAKDRYVPAGFQVWIGSLDKQRGAFKSYYHETRPDATHKFQLDVFTFAAGFFAMQAVSFRWGTRNYRRHVPPGLLTQGSRYEGIAIPLWPSDGAPVKWPPERHLSESAFEEFVTRWSNVRVTGF